jgi:hypothetical protein
MADLDGKERARGYGTSDARIVCTAYVEFAKRSSIQRVRERGIRRKCLAEQ